VKNAEAPKSLYRHLCMSGCALSLQVLLLFPRADAQCDALERAADAGHYDLDVARSTEIALQSFIARQHDVVVVDTRQGSDVDAESFARSDELINHLWMSFIV